jgi:hypothetical protein
MYPPRWCPYFTSVCVGSSPLPYQNIGKLREPQVRLVECRVFHPPFCHESSYRYVCIVGFAKSSKHRCSPNDEPAIGAIISRRCATRRRRDTARSPRCRTVVLHRGPATTGPQGKAQRRDMIQGFARSGPSTYRVGLGNLEWVTNHSSVFFIYIPLPPWGVFESV